MALARMALRWWRGWRVAYVAHFDPPTFDRRSILALGRLDCLLDGLAARLALVGLIELAPNRLRHVNLVGKLLGMRRQPP